MAARTGAKGHRAEEALRSYFLSIGYYVARSVPFFYKGFDITDVDLWLYMKSSTVSRERLIVDVKYKKTPQALERVFWCKGLQTVLCVDRCLVATSDNRKETREFGDEHGITVLHGDFLQRIASGFTGYSERVTEEVFGDQIRVPCVLESSIVWPTFYRTSKADLLTNLGFGSFNRFLRDIRFLLEEYLASRDGNCVAALRLLYGHVSYLLLSIDHVSRLISHLETDARQQALADGFRFGDAGRQRSEEILKTAMQLVEESSSDLLSQSSIEEEIRKQLAAYPAEMLAEFFATPENLKQAFSMAKEFEALAFAVTVARPDQCSARLKALIGLLCDFFKIDRRKVI